jgi:hypothetical protein
MILVRELKGLPHNYPQKGKDSFRLLPYEAKEFKGTPTPEMVRESELGWIHLLDVPTEEETKIVNPKGGKA